MVKLSVQNGDPKKLQQEVGKIGVKKTCQIDASDSWIIGQNGSQNKQKASSHLFNTVNEMFQDRSVFVTGGSGFLGRVLLAKLLSSYPGIKRIYVLMRAKKGVSPDERLQKDIIQLPVFEPIRARPDAAQLLAKLVVVNGELSEPWFGLSREQLEKLISDPSLSIIFHSAATIRFDEPLKVAINLNLTPTQTIIDLCRSLPNLICYCHVSTAYVNAHIKHPEWIEEKLYPISEDPKLMINCAKHMPDKLLDKLTETVVGDRPNTYTYTKALSEHLIAREASDLPVVIVRPSIVVAAREEPLPGWIDNLNGPTGLVLAVGKGVLRTMHVKINIKADIIPVDTCVNTIIGSTFYAAKKFHQNKMELGGNKLKNHLGSMVKDEQEKKDPLIVHCNSGDLNPITWAQIEQQFIGPIRLYPSKLVLRYPGGSFKRYYYQDLITRFFVHLLPALFLDFLLRLSGRKGFLIKTYDRLYAAIEALSHFALNNYNFRTKNIKMVRDELNPEDRKCLNMEIEELKWEQFWHVYVLGVRRYILKENDDSIEKSRVRLNMALKREQILSFLLISLAIGLSYIYLWPMLIRTLDSYTM